MVNATHFLWAIVTLSWVALIMLSIRKLGRKATNFRERTELVVGARGFGLFMWVVAILMPALLGIDRSWQLAAFIAFWLLPVCLWLGWVWGYLMASFFEARRN